MIYPEMMVGIENRIADSLAVTQGGTWHVHLGYVEKTKEVKVTIKAGETTGQADFVLNTDKKVLVTEIQVPSGISKYSLGKTGSDVLVITDHDDDIAIPFLVNENTSLTIYAEVDTAPSSDTEYTFVVKYLDVEAYVQTS